MSRVTLHDVALEAGVSDSTVSRALRGLDKVDENTRVRVRQAAQQLHFSFSRNAASLASGRTMRVSLLFSDALNTWFDSSVLQGAYDVLFARNYDIIPNTVRTYSQLHAFFDRLPSDGNVDALIVASINLDGQQTRILKQLTIPTVGLDSRTIDGFDASVLVDDRRAMADVVRLLKHLRHRHIAFVGWPAPGDFQFSTQLRAQAFMGEACAQGYAPIGQDAGAAGVQKGEVRTGPTDNPGDVQRFDMGRISDYRNNEDALASAVARILSAEPRPTAICVETDAFAVPLIARLREFGIRVPEDISVVGFDDTDVAVAVGLTTVHQDPVMMSRLASQKALALMEGQTLDTPHSMMRPTLRVRGTTAPVPRKR